MVDNTKYKKFTQKTDFMWRSVAVYSVVLLMYSVLRGTIESEYLTLKLYDPIVILLALFIVITILSIFYRMYINKTIIINDSELILKNRLGSKNYSIDEIADIRISKKKVYNTKTTIRVIKLGIKGRERLIKIRPVAYDSPEILINEIIKIKKRLH